MTTRHYLVMTNGRLSSIREFVETLHPSVPCYRALIKDGDVIKRCHLGEGDRPQLKLLSNQTLQWSVQNSKI